MKRYLGLFLAALLAFNLCACGQKTSVLTWQEQYELGVRYLSEGNYEEAIIAFAAAIRIEPKNEDLYLKLTETYICIEDFEGAKETLSIAAEILGETDAIMQAKTQLQNLIMQDDVLFKEIGEDGLNQYGGTPFILRENYVPFSELDEAGQTFFNQVIEALSANQRDELLALAEAGAVLLSEQTETTGEDHIYTACKGYKICLEAEGWDLYEEGAYQHYGWSIQIRPVSGLGYFARVSTKELLDVTLIEDDWYYYWNNSVELASCSCNEWQWNGPYLMEDTSCGEQYIDGENRGIAAYSKIIGELKNSLRHGNFYEDGYVTYELPDGEAWTSESDGEAVFQDGLCINVIKDGRHALTSNGRSRYTIDGAGYGYDLTMKKMVDILYW